MAMTMAINRNILVHTLYKENVDTALGGGFYIDIIGNDYSIKEYLSEYLLEYIGASEDMPVFVRDDMDKISPFSPDNFDSYKKSVLNKLEYIKKDINYLHDLINASSNVEEYKKIMNNVIYKNILEKDHCLLEVNSCHDHIELLLKGTLVKVKFRFDGINEKLVNFFYFKTVEKLSSHTSNMQPVEYMALSRRNQSRSIYYEMASASEVVSANASVKSNAGGDVKIRLSDGRRYESSWMDKYGVAEEDGVAEWITSGSVKRSNWTLEVYKKQGSYQASIAGWSKK